jgi:hypothetical protein
LPYCYFRRFHAVSTLKKPPLMAENCFLTQWPTIDV